MNFPTPSELEAACGASYSRYMDRLNGLWLAAGHPDVDENGRPRSRRIDDKQRAALMYERLGGVASKVSEDAWHTDCYSPRSSQALVVEAMGLLAAADSLDLVIGMHDVSLGFEEVNGRTNFDVTFRSRTNEVVATLEAKFTEEGFGKCSYPGKGRCDGSWRPRDGVHRGCPMAEPLANRATADRYWDAAVELLGLNAAPPAPPITCPIWAAYQMVHNVAETRALNPTATWTLLYDDRNPYFGNTTYGWAKKLSELSTTIRVLSWQELFAAASDRGCRVHHLMALHGF